jgi:beta-phosphoglucomutase-like phosphatase (HAD superfamily)
MIQPGAFIFDLNGTMIDDMEYHAIAWEASCSTGYLGKGVFRLRLIAGLAGLGVSPAACVVFEDAPKGVEAALLAGMSCVVLTTMHSQEEFSQFSNIIGYIADYTDPLLDQFFK